MTSFATVSRAPWWSNRRTAEPGPGSLLPLTYLYKRYPDAPVAVFPSDQFILEADRLMDVSNWPKLWSSAILPKLVLLGVTPDYEESDYGYILPTSARDISGWGLRRVQTFI